MSSGAAFNPPSFDLAYVISDLHIGGEPDRQIFESSSQFLGLIRHILAEAAKLLRNNDEARILFVINGDFVDFLAETDASVFNLDRSTTMLEKIFHRKGFRDVLKGLQDYVKAPGTHLV